MKSTRQMSDSQSGIIGRPVVRGRTCARTGRMGSVINMCGICGIVGHPDHSALRAMTRALRHRGPDDTGYFVDRNAALGIRRLAIIDVPNGHQPMSNEDGSIVAVFNGEIYNAAKLRDDLTARGHRLTTRCDTEVLPHLYETYGDEFASHLDGQFAVAIWDLTRRRLLLTRDRLGIKPLFYTQCGRRFLFGSEIKAIIAGLGRCPDIDRKALSHYLSLKYVPAPMTIYQGISVVLPGEQVAFRCGWLMKRRYWHLDPATSPVTDIEAATDRLESMLVRSVRRRMVADVPVGAMLSGGLDSSLLVAIASECASGPLTTFTLDYEDDFEHKRADVHAARKVARQFGTDHHEHKVSCQTFLAELPRVMAAFDGPFAGVVSPYFLHRLVRRHVKVCLSGDGADELFGSYLAHRLAQPIQQLLIHGETALRARPDLAAPFQDDLERLCAIARPQDWMWRSGLCVFSDEEKRRLLNADHAGYGRVSTTGLIRDAFHRCWTDDPLNRQLGFDIRDLLPNLVLAFNDRLSMAHSVETRVPFLDHELVSFASALPGDLKIRRGRCKWILKEVARRRLPAAIVDRPKEGFVMPVNEWQRRALRPTITETLAADRLALHHLFNTGEVARLVTRYYNGETDLQYKVWALFCFQTWYEQQYPKSLTDERAGDAAPASVVTC